MGSKRHIVIFALISFLVFFPYLNKYYMSLDFVCGPEIDYGDTIAGIGVQNSSAPFFMLYDIFSDFFGSKVVCFLILFSVTFFSMMNAFNMVGLKRDVSRYFCAFLYAFNPFTYSRFVVGHITFLLGYAFFPIFVSKLISFFFYDEHTMRDVIMLSLIVQLTGFFSPHVFLICLVFFVFFYGYNLLLKKKLMLKEIVMFGLVLFLFNLYWLVPSFFTSPVGNIVSDDALLYKPRPKFANALTTTAMLLGFWREEAYLTFDMSLLFPLLLFCGFLFLIIRGWLRSDQDHKRVFLLSAVLFLFMAAGFSLISMRGMFRFLFDNFAFYKGFRDSNKFSMVLCCFYAYFSGLGLSGLKKKKFVFLLSLIFLPLFFFQFNGNVIAQDFPDDYYEVQDMIGGLGDNNILILPWHQYMDFSWNENKDKRLSNVFLRLFDNAIVGDNVEMGYMYSGSSDMRSRYIEEILAEKDKSGFAESLRLLNVKYILIAKEVDYENYLDILEDKNLILMKNMSNLILLKNDLDVSLVYVSDGETQFRPLDYTKKSRSSIIINGKDVVSNDSSGPKYVLYSEPFDNLWNYDGNSPENLFGLNLFYGAEDGRICNVMRWIVIICRVFSCIFLFIFGLILISNDKSLYMI